MNISVCFPKCFVFYRSHGAAQSLQLTQGSRTDPCTGPCTGPCPALPISAYSADRISELCTE